MGDAALQALVHPRPRRLWLNGLECLAYRVLADDFVQPQRLRSHRVAANARDMGVPFATGQDAEHQSTQYVAHARRVGTAVAQRAALYPTLEDARSGQELGEVDDLAMRCGLGSFVPAHMHSAPHRLHRHKLFTGLRDSRLLALD